MNDSTLTLVSTDATLTQIQSDATLELDTDVDATLIQSVLSAELIENE